MPFAITALDKPDGLETRMANRPAHLAHLEAHRDHVVLAGPFLGEDGSPVGSLLVVDYDDRADAERFVADDPYSKADLFQSVTIRPMRVTVTKAS